MPSGIIGVIEPELKFEKDMGLDMLRNPAHRPLALQDINMTTIDLIGPIVTTASIQGLVGRYSIFVPGSGPNDTFGLPPPFNRDLFSPSGGNCPSDLCYRNSTVSKFWGFSQVVLGWQTVVTLAGLYDLCSSYQFMLTGDDDGHDANVAIAQCSDVISLPSSFRGIINGTRGSGTFPSFLSRQPVSVAIPILDEDWTLWIVNSQGWVPSWHAPLIAVVIIVAVIFSLLLLLLMASFLEQGQALAELQGSNKKLYEARTVLEAEKAHTDALIIRHLNLISCFSDDMNKARTTTSMEDSTLERIEAVRRHLNIGGSDQEEIEILELLGSGSFGKVYRGLWRGTQVAIKAIVLPANMSGTAKREKMAIMEAAISTALTHPNIVQTYTYAIRPIRDTVQLPSSELGSMVQVTSLDSYATSMNGTQDPSSKMNGSMASSAQPLGQIFSYEIRLVLEFCDLGCLRDALDAGVFLGTHGFNFSAVLDTALDIARAMHHLHMSNVLHMDLKARNIMVKSSGGDGRGVVAKVADFGLSVSLDSNQTHASSIYQGTITHMAPEALMKGQVSKASDVYAFGITLWEIFTGENAFSNIPGPHLGHAITTGKRPAFSPVTPSAYQRLAEACWAPYPESRPTFAQILQALKTMKMCQPSTPSLDIARLKEAMARAPFAVAAGSATEATCAASKARSTAQARAAHIKARAAPPSRSRANHVPSGIVVGGAGFSTQGSSGSFSSLGLGKPLERVVEVRESIDELPEITEGSKLRKETSTRVLRSSAIDEEHEVV